MAIVVEFLLAGFTDNSGNPLASGKVYTYEAGTTTPKAVYTDNLGATPEANPVILDSNGRKQVYAEGSYKFVVKTSADVTLYTFDNLNFGTGAITTFLGTTSGSSNLYVATPTPAISAYTDGALFSFQAHQINTAAATLNISSLGAKNVTSIPGQLVTGFTYLVRYKSSTDTFSIINIDPGYATTPAEISALNTAGVPIIIRQAVTLTGNLTLTAPLEILKGGSIVTNGNTLTINGPFTAGLYSCFTTAASNVIFGKGSIKHCLPEWFGAIGDGTTNCGTAIDIAIAAVKTNGGTIWFSDGTYLITTQRLLTNVSNVSLASDKGILYMNAEAAEFELAEACDRLTFDGLTFLGPGTDWTTPNAIISSASSSALNITNLTIKNCVFKDLAFAVHLNANLSGQYTNARVENCRFINIVGTASGHGNGLVMAGPLGRFVGGVVIGCTFEKCNRHALYCEAVTSVTIVGCSFYKHRIDQTTTDTPFFSALNVARSRHVAITGCLFDSNNDLCVQLYQDDGSGAQDCGPYSVIGCTFRNSTWRDLLIGSDSPDSPIYPLNGVIVANNTFFKNGANAVSAIYYGSGTEVDIHDNYIDAQSQTSSTTLITLENPGDASGRSGNVKVHDNIFKAATSSGTIRCITPVSAVCTGTRVFEIYNNICSIGGSDSEIFYPTTVTNLNLRATLASDSRQVSGTYTPTASALTNLDAATPSLAQYMRVGNVVTVSGRITLDATAGVPTATSVELTLPIPSDIQGVQDLAGVVACGAIVDTGDITGVIANNTAKIAYMASITTSQTWAYTFTYRVR